MSTRINDAASVMKDALGRVQRPALLLSGGKESTLLLYILLRELHHKIDCIFWHEDFEGQTERIDYVRWLAFENDLMVSNWPPAWRGSCVTDTGVDLLLAYDIGGSFIATGVETVDESYPKVPCYHDWLRRRTEKFPLCPYGLLIHGGRKEDVHPVFGSTIPYPEQQLGHVKVLYPLFDWQELEVWDAIGTMDIPYDKNRYDHGQLHGDQVQMCTRCVDTSKTGQAWCGMIGRDIPYGSLDLGQKEKARSFD